MRTRSQAVKATEGGEQPSPLRVWAPPPRTRQAARPARQASARATTASPPAVAASEAAAEPIAPMAPSLVCRGPAEPQSLLHVWVDARAEVLASARPVEDPSVSLAVPTSMIPALLALVGAGSRAPQPTTNPATPMAPRAQDKRKLADDAEMSRVARRLCLSAPAATSPIRDPWGTGPVSQPARRRKGGSFRHALPYLRAERASREVMIYHDDSDHRSDTDVAGRQATAAQTATEAWTPVPVQPTPAPERVESPPLPAHPPVTPERVIAVPVTRWRNLVNRSARSVSRYIPGFGRSATAPVAQNLPGNGGSDAPSSGTGGKSARSFRHAKLLAHLTSQTGPQQSTTVSTTSPTTIETSANENNDSQMAKEKSNAEVAPPPPGSKRRRIPSPDTIPNPVGGGYGMNLDYFGSDSSDEETQETQDTQTEQGPSKRARIDHQARLSRNHQLSGARDRARPYSGVMFADPNSMTIYQGGNIFAEHAARVEAREEDRRLHEVMMRRARAAAQVNAKKVKPRPSPGTFKVPSPTSSDSDFGDSPHALPVSHCPVPGPHRKEPLRPLKGILKKGKAPETWKEPPPPRPTPSHAALPAAVGSKDLDTQPSSSQNALFTATEATSGHPTSPPVVSPVNGPAVTEALKKARQKAQQYQPRRPSMLRRASEIESGSSPASSDEELTVPSTPSQETTRLFSTPKGHDLSILDKTTPPDENNPTRQRMKSQFKSQFKSYKEWRQQASPKVLAELDGHLKSKPMNRDLAAYGVTEAVGVTEAIDDMQGIEENTEPVIIPSSSSIAINPRSALHFAKSTPSNLFTPKVNDFLDEQWALMDQDEVANAGKKDVAMFTDEDDAIMGGDEATPFTPSAAIATEHY